MNKKKGKNKQNKPPNPTPPQKEDEPVNPPEEVVESVVEDRVPNIVSENVPVEVKETEETPKKPKRNRGKKKKDDEKSDKEDDVKAEDPVPVVPSQTVEDTLSGANIEPTARKKKNKNKKNQEPVQEEKIDDKIQSEVKLEESDKSQEVPVQKEEETETETKSSKKKNKKKKNRNDSERSEKEDVSCTSAFQQLMVDDEKAKENTEKVTKATTKQGDVKEILVTPEVNIAADVKSEEETFSKDEGHKNKKKNKKDKKHPPVDQPKSSHVKTDDTLMPSDNARLTNQDVAKDIIEPAKTEESTPKASATEQESPKLKAKIAKPVEKKKKGKGDEKNIEEKPECVEEPKTSKTEPSSVTKLAEIEVLPTVDSKETVSQTEISPNWHEENKPEEANIPVIDCEKNDEKSSLLQPFENVEKNKKRKKSPKPNRRNEKPVTPEIPIDTEPPTSKCDEIKPVEQTTSPVEQMKPKDEVTCEVKSDVISKELQTSGDKIEHIKAITEHDKKTKGKKSPMPQRKNAPISSEMLVPVVPEAIKIDENLTAKVEVKAEELPVQHTVTHTAEGKKDETERILTPDNEKRQKRKKSPMPQRKNAPASPEFLTTVGPEAFKKDESLTANVEVKAEEIPVPVAQITEGVKKDEIIRIPTPDSEKRQKRKKSPMPQRKNAPASSEILIPVVPEAIEGDESLPAMVKVKTEEIPVPVAQITEEVKRDEIERFPTPDSEKRQKRKKSPKTSIDIEVASSSKGKGKHNVLNIDDIIIIQAEVVSEDKAKQGDTFIASGEEIKSQDKLITEEKPDSEKPKKGKKSPKPTKRDLLPDFKTTIDPTDAKTYADILMPVFTGVPKPTDIKLPDTTPVEIKLPKVEPLPSPSDVTPDVIEYPRSSSEQLFDTNNNTVIREISGVETKLGGSVNLPDTPFIRSTDLRTPESTSSEIKMTHVKPVMKVTDEKTDLKSKVMEVNQDMEELRMSIERSLAELTSLDKTDTENEKKMLEDNKKNAAKAVQEIIPLPAKVEQTPVPVRKEEILKTKEAPLTEEAVTPEPVCPERKDRKGKGKSKKKGKQEVASSSTLEPTTTTASSTTDAKESTQSKDDKQEDKKTDQKSEKTQEKGKQQSSGTKGNKDTESTPHQEGNSHPDFEPIENFEDAMTSSVDDVNKTFEIIANEANPRLDLSQNNPEINVIAPQEDDKGGRPEKQNPVSPPKNLLGHPDIPVQSSRTDYKKERNKTPNYRQAKVKIKDLNDDHIEAAEKSKESKESQTENKRKIIKSPDESICVTNKNEDYIYKYSFRKVFLQCACHVCKKDLTQSRVPCSFCNLIFYCNQKHKDEDYPQHQALCFAVSTIVHLKDQKFIYADAVNITGHNYRLLRMQTIVSSEKVLKRRLAPWEQEALLYPRVCADAACREWRQARLNDCAGCGQISYCSEHPEHLPKTHARWCKSYNLYRSLVRHQQTLGRLEPKLPTRVVDLNPMPDNINEVLANMYEERIDMSDIEYAALTQLATAPLTALYCLQAYKQSSANGVTKKSTLTLHIVGAELQFEADVLNKWEVFLLHLMPHVKELRIVLVGPDLNPSNLPLELLGKIKLCENCRQSNRRVVFDFQDKRTYHDFWASDDFTTPDLVCAFNPSIQRSATYNGKDSWPSTITCILKLRTPFAITSYTLSSLVSDLARAQECGAHSAVCSPRTNSFASVRPDRNFISDDEAPLLFKNHCVAVVCGV